MNKSNNMRLRDSSPNGEARRGLRNNNPLNIRYNPRNRWRGQVPNRSDMEFCQFTSMRWGIRAAFILMINYHKQGINTPRQIITRWAPPSENNTEGYINSVAMLLNGKLDMDARMQRREDFCLLAQAMAWVETGRQLPDKEFEEAWKTLPQQTLPLPSLVGRE